MIDNLVFLNGIDDNYSRNCNKYLFEKIIQLFDFYIKNRYAESYSKIGIADSIIIDGLSSVKTSNISELLFPQNYE